jgi:hypothetical protein
MEKFAIHTGGLNLLGSEARSDGIPTAAKTCFAAVVSGVQVNQPMIGTRQMSSLTKRGFSFTIGDESPVMGLTGTPQTEYLRAGINTSAAVEVVVLSQGDLYDGTTLTRGDYAVVCVPQFEIPAANQIYVEPWAGDPPPVGSFVHDVPDLLGVADTIVLSSVVQDSHTGSGNWTDPLETVIPISGANAAAFLAMIARADKWRRRQAPWGRTDNWPIRVFITARAPYLTGGAGCSLNIIGAYVRAVY